MEARVSFVSDSDWRKWGQIDPYFGVVSFDEFKVDRIDENRTRFFDTGRREIEIALGDIASRYDDVARRRALEFCSGVGRLALPLAEHYEEVVGVAASNVQQPPVPTRLLPKGQSAAVEIALGENPNGGTAFLREAAAGFAVHRIPGELLP